jgi:hypothetical protein
MFDQERLTQNDKNTKRTFFVLFCDEYFLTKQKYFSNKISFFELCENQFFQFYE